MLLLIFRLECSPSGNGVPGSPVEQNGPHPAEGGGEDRTFRLDLSLQPTRAPGMKRLRRAQERAERTDDTGAEAELRRAHARLAAAGGLGKR